MKRSRVPPTEEYIEIAVALVLRVLHDGIELFDFRDECWIGFREVATKLGQDLDSLDAAAVGNQPSTVSC